MVVGHDDGKFSRHGSTVCMFSMYYEEYNIVTYHIVIDFGRADEFPTRAKINKCTAIKYLRKFRHERKCRYRFVSSGTIIISYLHFL